MMNKLLQGSVEKVGGVTGGLQIKRSEEVHGKHSEQHCYENDAVASLRSTDHCQEIASSAMRNAASEFRCFLQLL